MTNGTTAPRAELGPMTGPGASALKYDILTALLVTATQGDPVPARLALRLSLVITARFNWRLGTFAVGQRELARMWGVTERTAKREMAEMRQRGWITVDLAAARGRVARHRIDLRVLLHATMAHWEAVGPDFAARMVGAPEPETPGAQNVIPLRRPVPAVEAPEGSEGSVWATAARRLQAQDPGIYQAWFAPLQPLDRDETPGVLTLMAPSRFVADYITTHYRTRLLAALAAEDRSIREVRIIGTAAPTPDRTA